ncbi:MAG: hypothetical protein IJT84_00275 [Clostridia bacterium]|nr:hypothetical protein [Clostridia bacterium]
MKNGQKIKNVFVNEFDFENNKKTYKELSNNLVDVEQKGYDFDRIIQKSANSSYKSLDSIVVKEKEIIFIEFKQGFEDRVNKNTFSQSIIPSCKLNEDCDDLKTVVEKGYNCFFEKREAEKKILIDDLILKAFESITFFNNFVISKSCQTRKDIKIIYLIIVDSLYFYNQSYTIKSFKSYKLIPYERSRLIQAEMNKYRKIKNLDGESFCDEIYVLKPQKFEELLKRNFDDICS